jgi:predicted transcriptional regulator
MNDQSFQIIQPLVARIVSGYLKKNPVSPGDMASLITTVSQSLISVGKAAVPQATQSPAVPVRQSVRFNYVVCLECGARGQMLRKHLWETHGLNPAEYRAKWGLSSDHPITAPAYSEQRSAFAKKIGLGRGTTRRRRRQRSG